ncbi:MAG: hypothetical protein GOVbin631_34 [Prokaryotic dsDNA virus sp.]|nr:MAG: hypothetical protein GOVbin631_34 [Prokaryotic dsDNA virus sp.]|tara:strand:- start:13545 stop:13838 length:294 start_codon:yes stop_codon:yes gene_type:complete
MSKDYKTVHYDGVYKMPVKDADGQWLCISVDCESRITIVTDGCGYDRESHIEKIEDVYVSLESVVWNGESEWVEPNPEMLAGIEKYLENKFSRGLIE